LIGLAMILYLTVVWPVIAFDNWTTVVTKAAIVIVIVMALSMLWGLFGPAKKPKGRAAPPPAPVDHAPPPAGNEPAPPPTEHAPPPAPDDNEPPPPPPESG
jgi:type IV secretory pathway VirB10-like protein